MVIGKHPCESAELRRGVKTSQQLSLLVMLPCDQASNTIWQPYLEEHTPHSNAKVLPPPPKLQGRWDDVWNKCTCSCQKPHVRTFTALNREDMKDKEQKIWAKHWQAMLYSSLWTLIITTYLALKRFPPENVHHLTILFQIPNRTKTSKAIPGAPVWLFARC